MLSKSDRTKLLIIEKSAALFNKKGFAGTSMSDIQEATGLAKGGVYGNFQSKEEIAIQAFDYAFEKVIAEIAMKIKPKHHMADKLLAILDYYRNYSVRSPIEGGCPMINYGSDADDSFPLLREKVARAMNQSVNELVQIIKAGKKRKQIKPGVDPEMAAEIIFSQINGSLLMAKISGNPRKLNRMLDYLKAWIDREMRTSL
jgi:TetR/AcrR family transcriptional regulator, transcriptional repressor for nem operon